MLVLSVCVCGISKNISLRKYISILRNSSLDNLKGWSSARQWLLEVVFHELRRHCLRGGSRFRGGLALRLLCGLSALQNKRKSWCLTKKNMQDEVNYAVSKKDDRATTTFFCKLVQVVGTISLDDMHLENIWFSWSKPSNYREKLRCHACDKLAENGKWKTGDPGGPVVPNGSGGPSGPTN